MHVPRRGARVSLSGPKAREPRFTVTSNALPAPFGNMHETRLSDSHVVETLACSAAPDRCISTEAKSAVRRWTEAQDGWSCARARVRRRMAEGSGPFARS